MSTENIQLTNPDESLFTTSTPPHKINSYGLENSSLANNSQILFIDSTIENYQILVDNLV